jgi:hypothetical protein
MLDTLGLGDPDDVEMVRGLEEIFDISFTDKETRNLVNVGDLYNLILRKIPRDESNRKCASAMAFYRLRRAFADLRQGKRLSPGAELAPTARAKRLFRELARRTGLTMPDPAFSWIGKMGGYMALLWPFAMIWAVAVKSPPHALAIFCLGALPAAFLLAVVDPRRVPAEFPTLGALAKKVARLNYGRLVKEGAEANDAEIWEAFVEVVTSITNVPAEKIGRETLFFSS